MIRDARDIFVHMANAHIHAGQTVHGVFNSSNVLDTDPELCDVVIFININTMSEYMLYACMWLVSLMIGSSYRSHANLGTCSHINFHSLNYNLTVLIILKSCMFTLGA